MTDILVFRGQLHSTLVAKSQEARLCFVMDFTDYHRNDEGEMIVLRSTEAADDIIEGYRKQGMRIDVV